MAPDALRAGIERRTGIALWRQIADAIRAGITSGLGDESGKLPPETELAEQFGVNRHTVRSAISALVSEGILRAEQGRGTFIVKNKRLTYSISKRTRFSTSLAQQGRSGQSRMLSHDTVPANAEVAAALEIEEGRPVVCLRTLGTGDDVPISRSTSWFDATRFPDFINHFNEYASITKALAAGGLGDYIRVSTLIEAYHATIDDIELLGLSPGAIVLVTHAINADLDGKRVEYSKTRFSADRVNLQIDLDRISKE